MGGLTFLFDTPPNLKANPIGVGFELPKIFTAPNVEAFTRDRAGPIYWLPECEVMGFVHSPYSDREGDRPDIQMFFASYADSTDGGLFSKRASGYTDDFYSAVYEKILYKDAFNIIPLLLKPKSRGRIRLKDKNPSNPPLIYPNYFDDARDEDILVSQR